jgi:diguanylate cyclase (GGDEF)-like protein
VIAACALSVLLVVLFSLQSRASDAVVDAERGARRAESAIATASALERRVVDLETGLRGFALTGDERFLEPFDRARETFPRQIVLLRRLVAGDAEIDALEDEIRAYVVEYAPRVREQAASGTQVQVISLAREGKLRVDEIRARFADVIGEVRAVSSARQAEAESRADRARRVGWIAIAVGLGGLALLTAYFLRKVIAPIQRIRTFARRVAAGERDVKLDVQADGEIRDLATAVDQMAGSLAEQERAARRHADNLAAVADVAHKLSTAEARAEIADAACRLAGATVAVLLEPDGAGNLVSTATAGGPINSDPIPIDPAASTAARVLLDGRALFSTDLAELPPRTRQYVEETGAEAALWQPIAGLEGTVAVLVVGWDAAHADVDQHAMEVIRLLAAEAAIAVERSDLLESLRHAADHDPLTGLVNRRRFHDELDRHVALSERHHRDVAVLVVDLDGFKAVNDREGHAAGDDLLRRVGEVLTKRARSTDVVARLGGDEFAVLLPETGAAEAERLAGTIARAIGDDAGVGASVGSAASVPDARLGREELVARADATMYEVKGRR